MQHSQELSLVGKDLACHDDSALAAVVYALSLVMTRCKSLAECPCVAGACEGADSCRSARSIQGSSAALVLCRLQADSA